MSDDLVKRLRQPWDTDRSIMSQTGRWMTEREDAADRIEELQARAEVAEAKLARTRNEALEEAARVATREAENFAYASGSDFKSPGSPHDRGRQECGYAIAAAIRAMMEEQKDE